MRKSPKAKQKRRIPSWEVRRFANIQAMALRIHNFLVFDLPVETHVFGLAILFNGQINLGLGIAPYEDGGLVIGDI